MIPKPRLRYLFYLIGGVAYLLTCLGPVCLMPTQDMLLKILPLFIFLLVLELAFLIGKSYVIKSYLDKGDPQRFLEETRKEGAYAPNGQWKDFYKINSTAGLYYLGRFDEALRVLDEVRPEKLRHRMYRILYYNNKLANLLGAGRVKDAAALVRAQKEIFRPDPRNKKFYPVLRANLGVLKYLQGEREMARPMLEESLRSHRGPLGRAVAHYYLACLLKDLGLPGEAHGHVVEARRLGRNSFVAKRIEQSL